MNCVFSFVWCTFPFAILFWIMALRSASEFFGGWCLWYIFYQLFLAKKHRTERKPDGSVKYDYVDEYEEGDDLIINFKKI